MNKLLHQCSSGTQDARIRRVTNLFIVMLAASAMGAISIGPVPVQWFALVGMVVVYFKLPLHFRKTHIPGATTFYIFLIWAMCVTLFSSYDAPSMPTSGTTIYPIYLSLRFFKLAAFWASISIVYWLVVNGRRDVIVRWVVILGCAVSVLAIYVYVAQIVGLPDIPRTRLGTGGGVASTTFSYAFHRAMGSFQEPSHLAEWLILPLLLSIGSGGSVINYRSALIGIVVLLTGSLTGIVGAVIGGVGAMILLAIRNHSSSLWVLKAVVQMIFLIAFLIFIVNITAHSNEGEGVDLLGVIVGRTIPILNEGMEASNRGDVYEFVSMIDIPIFGYGLGNFNLLFTKYLGVDVVASVLSLYLNTLFSLGLVGIFLLAIFLTIPILLFFRKNVGVNVQQQWAFIAAYISWLVMFSGHSEEVSMMFSISYALVATISVQKITRKVTL